MEHEVKESENATSSDFFPYSMEPRRTSRFLSKYEFAKLIGMLALELQENKTSHELVDVEDIYKYAAEQIIQKKYDAVISRSLPNGNTEDVHLSVLNTTHLVI